jgi:hypothetical protein
MLTLWKLWDYLNGKKTYLCGLAMVLVAGSYHEGYITEQAFKALEVLLLGAGVASLRHAVGKS